MFLLDRAREFCRREPLVHFAFAALLLFSLHAWWSPDGPEEKITLTSDTLDALFRQRTELLERPLSPEEREGLIEEHIDQEILLREAYKRGLDRKDGSIRHRLIDKMRFLLGEEPAAPTEGDLEAFYRVNPKRYEIPETLSLEHVFFPGDGGAAPPDAASLLARLRAGAAFERMGDRFWLGPQLARYGRRELIQILGRDFTETVFRLDPGSWTGPLTSTRGFHFVRVREKHPAEPPSFERLRNTVREDWYLDRQKEAYREKVRELRKRYEIEVEAPVEPGLVRESG
jgi:peptidyl-prolyl cis-trans isomerase C